MGIKDVGTENLPNVYVDSIVISAGNQSIRVRCLIKDHKSPKSWRGRVELEDLSVRVVLFHDSLSVSGFNDATLGLNSGQDSLQNYSPNQTSEPVDYFSKSSLAREFNMVHTDVSMASDEAFYFKTFEFLVADQNFIIESSNITVYAACFMDGLNFDNEMFNRFYGPMASEKIIVGGSVNNTSGYFFDPVTNEEYGGPVHEHNGVYMVGSYHSDRPHATLRYVVEPNNKITVES
jgi:hypothetical protein